MPRRPSEAPVQGELENTRVPETPLDRTAFRTHAVRANPSKASRKKARAERMKKRAEAITAANQYLNRRFGKESASRVPRSIADPTSRDESSSSDSSVMSDEDLLMVAGSGSSVNNSSRSPNRDVSSGTPESPTTPPGLEHATSSLRRRELTAQQSGSSSTSTSQSRSQSRDSITEYAQLMSTLVMEDAEEAPIVLPRQRRYTNRTLLPRKPTKAVKKLDYARRMLKTELSLTTHNNGLVCACVHSACGSLCQGPRLLHLLERYWRYRTEAKRSVFLTSFMVFNQEEGKLCIIL